MPWRIYPMKQKYTKLDGTVSIYEVKNKKWIKSNNRYKPQKRGFEKKSIWSERFGFLDLYSRKEQQGLVCPSGYTISQCFCVLKKLWYAYHKSRHEKNLERIKNYAGAIQKVQEDMGIKTTSFPHLGLYGDVLILHNKNDERVVFEDHSELKKKQQEYEKWQVEQAENAKKIQEKLQKPDKEKGEEIVTFANDVSPHAIIEVENNEEPGPDLLQDKIDEEEGEEEEIVMTDDTPFQYQNEETVPDLLEDKIDEEEEEEEEIVMTDDTPFQNQNQNGN
jgi:uncharacterized protein YbaR (Trm112 family)